MPEPTGECIYYTDNWWDKMDNDKTYYGFWDTNNGSLYPYVWTTPEYWIDGDQTDYSPTKDSNVLWITTVRKSFRDWSKSYMVAYNLYFYGEPIFYAYNTCYSKNSTDFKCSVSHWNQDYLSEGVQGDCWVEYVGTE